MPKLAPRRWVPAQPEALTQRYARQAAALPADAIASRIEALAARSRAIHERECFNLNPATNVMNPRAEALLAAGLGVRPSLGWAGAKYETGLEAIEEIEVIAAELAAEVFDARFAEVRVGSGALANLYAFMATCAPGDAIIAPPEAIGGHVTHHAPGAAGLYGLVTHPAPVAADGYTVDVDGLARLARELRPKLITLGGSLNLHPHPVAQAREIADEVGAKLMVDAAHQCGMIAGGLWPNPLAEGAHLMTMSTYKSLGGPPGGLVLTNEADLAERIDAIAFPGLTANADAGRIAALAVALADWKACGAGYARHMADLAAALAEGLAGEGLDVFRAGGVATTSHQFALAAGPLGGGQAAAQRLRQAGFLACGIGLPLAPVDGDMNGLRLGTPELARWGVAVPDAPRMARLITAALTRDDPGALAPEVAAWRASFNRIGYVAA